MNLSNITKTSVFTLGILLGSFGATPAGAQTKQDNTGVNKRDRNPQEATADQQKANVSDRDLSAKIRKSIVGDKSLSTYAHNVKVISQNGTVTLKGPVRSEEEVKSIVSKATDITGDAAKVVNELSVEPGKKP